MGLCVSSSESQSTAKLILVDGNLEEYSYPIKVSFILSKYKNVFICNSDDMEFDDVLVPVNENEYLQLGQLYFALPMNKLSRRLQPEEMAGLAVKANAALLQSIGSGKCRKKTGFFDGSRMVSSAKVADFAVVRNRSSLLSGGLSVIPELINSRD